MRVVFSCEHILLVWIGVLSVRFQIQWLSLEHASFVLEHLNSSIEFLADRGSRLRAQHADVQPFCLIVFVFLLLFLDHVRGAFLAFDGNLMV